MTTVLFIDGIGTEKLEVGDGRSILEPIARTVAEDPRIKGPLLRVQWPAQMAGIGGRLTWRQASDQGVATLESLVRARPHEDLVLFAYSGGNLVLHNWLDRHPEHHHRIKACGFVSDPFRPHGKQQDGTPSLGGWGVCGQRKTPIMDRSYWTSVLDDAISNAHGDALLRTVADLSDRIPGGFLDDLWGHHRDGNWQLAWQMHVIRTNPLHWLGTLGPRLHQARLDIEGYMTGRHTTAYHEPFVTMDGGGNKDDRSLAARIAATVAWKASR